MKFNFKKLSIFALITSIVLNSIVFTDVKDAQAVVLNLIKGGTFEGDINEHWGFWKSEENNREYDYYRAYDAPFGNGSYSAAVDAKGSPADAFTAVLSGSTKNVFSIDMTKKYYLMFYARSTKDTEIITYLQRADNYNAISEFYARKVGNDWQKYMINVEVTLNTNAVLAFVVGNLPDDSTLYLDGIQLVEANNAVTTKSISGYIGDKNKTININNISSFTSEEIDIELPYYDNMGKGITTKRVNPSAVTASSISFTMPEATYSGVGRIYVNDVYLGQFNYNVMVKLNEFHPAIIRLNEDIILYGSGFSPVENSTFLIAEKTNVNNIKESAWVKPESFDSGLTQMRFRLPAGTIGGRMMVQTSYMNTEGAEVLNKSNQLPYSIKPVIVATNWSERGYEHVGDKLKIYGYGLGRTPIVNYYNENGVLVESIKATPISVGDIELIEAATTKKTNKFNIAVSSNGVMSDSSEALSYLAKPIISTIKSRYSRTITASDTVIPAAKAGESISISGISLRPTTGDVLVEFQAFNKRIPVTVDPSLIAQNGSGLSVNIPNGALSGYIGVQVNGVDSNYLPLEIIPTIVAITPDPVVPGTEIEIKSYGVGDKLELLKIEFSSGKEVSTVVNPKSISIENDYSVVRVMAPYNLSYSDTAINIQYDRWRDDGKEVLNIRPHIVRAGINMDTKILSIIGYGMSISAKENVLTFKYADENQTLVTPKIRVLGVYPSEEGQEIRVQILDNYHYGRVSVSVGDFSSNEVSFGPVNISKIVRRSEFVKSSNSMMGVLYISGYNFGSGGGVKVGERWAEIHYRSDFSIIAVVPEANLYDGPVIVARE